MGLLIRDLSQHIRYQPFYHTRSHSPCHDPAQRLGCGILVIYSPGEWPFILERIVSGESPDRAALPEVLLLSSIGGRIVPFSQPPGRNSVPVYPDNILSSAACSRRGNPEHFKCLSNGIDGPHDAFHVTLATCRAFSKR